MTKPLFITLITGFLAITPLLWAADSVFDEPPKIEDSVVMISCVKQDLNHVTPWKQTSMARGVGSGFIISGNRILTKNRFIDVEYFAIGTVADRMHA